MKDRKCQKCGTVKPIKEFSRCDRIESGYLWKCKQCEMEDNLAFIRSTWRWTDELR